MLFPICASPSACKDFSYSSYSHHDCNLKVCDSFIHYCFTAAYQILLKLIIVKKNCLDIHKPVGQRLVCLTSLPHQSFCLMTGSFRFTPQGGADRISGKWTKNFCASSPRFSIWVSFQLFHLAHKWKHWKGCDGIIISQNENTLL